jgi:hypothetical protein
MAGRGNLGGASSPSGISGVGHRTEKHAVVCVLSLVDLVLFEMAGSRSSHTARSTSYLVELHRVIGLRCCRDLEQIFDGDAADRAWLVLVVRVENGP